MFGKSRSSTLFLLPALLLSISVTVRAQNGASSQAPASVTILDSTKEQDGLTGSVRRVKTESARLEFKSGVLVEGPRELVELTTYALTGNRVENVSYPVSNTSVGKEEYKYDDKGHIVEMTLRGDRGTILSREAYDYEFDRFGNWTKMVTSLILFEDGRLTREPVEVTYRTLTYYYDDSIATAVSAPPKKKVPSVPTSAGSVVSGSARSDNGPNQLRKNELSQAVAAPVESSTPMATAREREESISSFRITQILKDTAAEPAPALEPETTAATPNNAKTQAKPEPPANKPESAGSKSQVSAAVASSEPRTVTPAINLTARSVESSPKSAAPENAKILLALEHYKKGSDLFEVGDTKGAVTSYLQAIQIEPRSAEFQLALGHAYLKLQKDKDAAKALKESVRLNPEVAEAHYGLGLTHFRLERFKDAADSFKKATILQPTMAKAHYGLALAYQELGKQDALIEQYRILQKLDGNLAKQLAQAFPDFNLPCRVPPFCR